MYHNEIATNVIKLSPPVAVSLASWFGANMSNLVLFATLVYTLLQIYITVRKMYKEYKESKNDSDKSQT